MRTRTSTALADQPRPSCESTSSNSSQPLSLKQLQNREKNKDRHKNKFLPFHTLEQVHANVSVEEIEEPRATKSDSEETRAGAHEHT